MSYRMQQINDYLRELLSKKIFEDFADEKVFISSVKTSSDLDHALVFVRTFPAKNLHLVENLNNFAHKWQGEIFKRLRVKKFPRLKFVYDDFEEKEISLIEELIKESKK